MVRATTKKTGKPGPKENYDESKAVSIYEMALLGLSQEEMRKALGIASMTLVRWRKDFPAVDEAIIQGKRLADSKVARGLYERAIGYSHDDVHIMANRVNEYKKGELVRSYVKPMLIPIVKHYPPETKAATFWLKNRTRDMEGPWSDRLEVSMDRTGMDLLHTLDMKDFTEDELDLLLKLSKKLNIKTEEKD